jgi:hypothetical protein
MSYTPLGIICLTWENRSSIATSRIEERFVVSALLSDRRIGFYLNEMS